MDLEYFIYLYLLLAIPIIAIGYTIHHKWQIAKIKMFGNSNYTKGIIATSSLTTIILKHVLKLIALTCLIIALANPRHVGSPQDVTNPQKAEIVFAIDISNSMLTEDVLPNRLVKAKRLALEMVNELNGESIGIVLFAGNAYSFLPLTTDYKYVRTVIHNISADPTIPQGTSLKNALQISGLLFSKLNGVSKFVCILSDGETNKEDYKTAADSLSNKNIKLISVGIGTAAGGIIKILKEDGSTENKKNKKGELLLSKLNSKALKNVVDNDDKSYFEQRDGPLDVKNILSATKNIKSTSTGANDISKDFYELFLIIGAALLFIEALFTLFAKF